MKHTILITGATGFIGSSLVKHILKNDGEESYRLLLLVRDKERAIQMWRGKLYKENMTVRLIECPLEKLESSQIEEPIDYMLHCAAPTTSAYMISNPVETADSIMLGTRNILELAKIKKVKSMVYLSSMEVYGTVTDIGRERKEEELGDLQINSARSCYSLGKRLAEHYCYIYAKEYGVPVKIARLAQTFGKGVRLEDNRVYMQFARAVVEKRDIVLKTEGLSMGNYCAIEDVVSAIFTILQRGEDGETYNVVNEANTMCIRDMAKLVAEQIAGGEIGVRVEAETLESTGYAPDTGLRFSANKLRQLGWQPAKGLVEMYRDVIAELQ